MVSRARGGEPGPAFPWRIMVDPYVVFGQVQDTATAPFYDWLLGIDRVAGRRGHAVGIAAARIAAWYPAVLAVFDSRGRVPFGQACVWMVRGALWRPRLSRLCRGISCMSRVWGSPITTLWRACW